MSSEPSPSTASPIDGVNSSSNDNNDSSASYTSSIPSLKTKITEEDKDRFRNMFKSLNPNYFWTLDATKRAAAEAGPHVKPLSVEEKIAMFALNSCHLQ